MIIIFIRRDLQGKPDDGISNRSMLGMDLSLKTSVNDDLRKEEDKSGFFKFHEDDDTEIFKVGKDKSDEDDDDDHCSNQSSTVHKDSNAIQKDHVESVKVEMGEIREENERLKSVLAQIVKNYQSLQTHFFDIVQQEQKEKSTENKPIIEEDTEPELVSLSLGTTLNKNKEVKTSNSNKEKADEEIKVGLSLALDSDFDASIQTTKETSVTHSTENSFEEIKEEEAGLQWPPSKALKTLKTSEEDASQQTHTKKARVSVRARCEAPTMHDGCQWRKYGQKISKGNPCPRAYYRCTVAPACPVRKQVQRCAEDMSILITTYEGTHNHPLPVSATAMASTTAAAANMLMSGSSTSRSLLGSSVTTTSITDLHGLNLNFSDNSRLTPFYPSNNTLISSSSFSSPTITLDLTSPPSLSSSSSQFNRFSPSFTSFPRYPSANFNFTSSSSTPQTKWNSNYLGYNTPSFHRNPIYPFARTSQDSFHQGYLQKNNVALPSPQQSLNETIAAATKVITSDPNFRSALASAITSIVGNGGSSVNQAIAENIVPSLKWGETLQSVPLYSTSTNVSGCASSFMTRSSSSNSQQSNLTILPSSLPFSSPKTTSPSSIQNRHHLN